MTFTLTQEDANSYRLVVDGDATRCEFWLTMLEAMALFDAVDECVGDHVREGRRVRHAVALARTVRFTYDVPIHPEVEDDLDFADDEERITWARENVTELIAEEGFHAAAEVVEWNAS